VLIQASTAMAGPDEVTATATTAGEQSEAAAAPPTRESATNSTTMGNGKGDLLLIAGKPGTFHCDYCYKVSGR
jgi:hypothetical protein